MATHPLWRPYSPIANAQRQSQRVAHRQVQPGPLSEYQARWAGDYLALRRLITDALAGQALALSHVGSTAVPGLVGKPVIDLDLTVPDVEDESVYLPAVEAVGFRLIFRDDLAGDSHRQLTFARPNSNLHVWSPTAVEPQRHALFTAWLLNNKADRDRYAAAKRAAAALNGRGRYNDLKSAAVYDIYERAFLADPDHPHDPHPRESGPGPQHII